MVRMKKLFGLTALGIGGIVSGSLAMSQTVERDTTITGPALRRTIKRPGGGPAGARFDRSVDPDPTAWRNVRSAGTSFQPLAGMAAADGRAMAAASVVPETKSWSARLPPWRESGLACWPRPTCFQFLVWWRRRRRRRHVRRGPGDRGQAGRDQAGRRLVHSLQIRYSS